MTKLVIILGLSALLLGALYMSQQTTTVEQLKMSTAQTYQEYLKDLAEEVNKLNLSWRAKYNPRWNRYDFESMKRLNGALDAPNTMEFWAPTVSDVNQDIPASFNAQTQWPGCTSISEIRDQANCGSCWSFGAAEAMTDRYCIAQGQKQNPRISMENILTCCTYCGYGCGGGYPIQAWKWWTQTGVVSGDGNGNLAWCQPYFIPSCGLDCPSQEETAPACSKQCIAGYTGTVPYSQDFFFGQSAYNVAANVAAIQTEIMTNGPVEATFQVYEDFYNYNGGVYVHTYGAYVGGHAIKIMGWGVENGQPYWNVTNSWSSQWGEDGFFQILRGVNECGIESGVTAGLPKV